MFGHNSMFGNDPFFSRDTFSEFDRMDRMMSDMHRGLGFQSIMGSEMDRRVQRDLMPFNSGMFGRNMFGDMNAMMSQMQNNPNGGLGHSFSSSSMISYSNVGDGAPKFYQASSQVMQGPDGVRKTRKTERNSETGLNKMAIGHHIHDRGHVVERLVNQRTNEREEKQDFINIDEADKDAFHHEWSEKARSSQRLHNAIGADRTRDHRQEPRALTSSEYHRQNVDRSRRRRLEDERSSSNRQEDRATRNVRLNSRPEEI